MFLGDISMNTFYLWCEKHKIQIFTSLLFIISSFTFRSFGLVLISEVTQKFSYILKDLPAILLYLLPTIYMVLFIKHFYFKKTTKPGFIVFISFTSLIIVISLIFFSLNFDTYIKSFTYHAINFIHPFDLVAIMVVCLSINITMITKIFFKRTNEIKEQEEQLIELAKSDGTFPFKNYQFILFIAYILFVLFFSANFVAGFSAIRNITLDPFGFVILELFNLLPLINLVLFVTDKKEKNMLRPTLVSLLNLSILLAFVVYQSVNPDFVVRIGKIFFPIDFALSFPIGPILLGINAVIPSIVFFIHAGKLYKESKRLNLDETKEETK